MKIAPRLQDHVATLGKFTGAEVRSELRALLGVARAADHDVSAEHHAIEKKGRALRCRLCRALARLKRVSRRKP